MAISVNWATKVINVPKADMTQVQVSPFEIRELDIDEFRLELKALEAEVVDAGAGGMAFEDTHRHNTEVTLGGVTLARTVEIINGYTVTFEDGSYAVNLIGANSNIADVTNLNGVQVRSTNSAGLVSLADIKAQTDKITLLLASLVASDLVIEAGSTTTAVRTNATQADGFYDGLIVVVINSAGSVARTATSYEQTNGQFNLDTALPFTPSIDDQFIVLSRVASAAASVDNNAVATAVWARTTTGASAGSYGELMNKVKSNTGIIPTLL